jgi:hypothetical protein
MEEEKQSGSKSGKTPIFLKPISKSTDETVKVKPIRPVTPTPIKQPIPAAASDATNTTPVYKKPEPIATPTPLSSSDFQPQPAPSNIPYYAPPAGEEDKIGNIFILICLIISILILGTSAFFLYQTDEKKIPPEVVEKANDSSPIEE